MLKDPDIKSIIAMSEEPLEDLSSVIRAIDEYIQMYQKTPVIVKPFLKRDIPSITQLGEKEWLKLLTQIRGNLENISKIAANVKDLETPSVSSVEVIESTTEQLVKEISTPTVSSFIRKRRRPRMNILFASQNNVEDVSTEDVSTEDEDGNSIEEEETKKRTVYCPECGHKCQGKKGLKVHIYKAHKDIREEMLKTLQLYKK
jgi:hypothetical protein